MATLVLTAVGTAIGGPIGGAIGSLFGQAADQRLFAPRGRTGARVTDLRLQTSSYGTPIARIIGAMRVAGTIIWATDLVEHRHRSGAKGRAGTTSYTYSASFAVALSSRRVAGLGRIWAEGNILRGAAGDWKTPVTMRFHNGDADQNVDPLIAAAEGAAHCPAYRGIAYAVFEDMDLSPYGNRIPSFSFELLDDAGVDRTMADVVADVVGDRIGPVHAAPGAPGLTGYAVDGPTRRDALEPLADILPIDAWADPADGQTRWRVGDDGTAPVATLPALAADQGRARAEWRRGAADAVPARICVGGYDPARDYQIGTQSEQVPGGRGADQRIAMPIAISADDGKALAAYLATRGAVAGEQLVWPTGFAALALAPGARVNTAVDGPAYRVAERDISGATVRLTLQAEPADAVYSAGSAHGGRALVAPDAAIGATSAMLFDVPGQGSLDVPVLMLAASGAGAGWRTAQVGFAPSADAADAPLGTIRAAAAMGHVVAATANPAASAALFDDETALIVALTRADSQLANAVDADVLGGTNLAIIGDEVIQFGRAQPLGSGNQWRLSRLLRGRRGTEDAMPLPLVGRPFALLNDAALMPVVDPLGYAVAQPGGHVTVAGVADGAPVVVPITRAGRAMLPLSPVHLAAQWLADGGLRVQWVRRSRTGFGWADGVDAPLDAAMEQYRLTVVAGGAAPVLVQISTPEWIVPAAQIAAWRSAGGGVSIAVAQWNANGASPAATLALPI